MMMRRVFLTSRFAVRGENMQEGIQVTGTWSFIWTDEHGNELRRKEEKNLVVNTGLYALADMVIGELDQTCAVWVAVGTGTTAAAAADTTLETESTRKVVTTKTRNSADIIYRFYLLTGEATGTWTEWGVFLEATSITDSGRMLNRILPAGGVTKASNENLTIEVRITLAAS